MLPVLLRIRIPEGYGLFAAIGVAVLAGIGS